MENAVDSKNPFRDDAIAIIGTSCRLPGDISNIEKLWDFIIQKRNAISDMPESRIPHYNSYINKDRSNGKIVTPKGGFIEDIEKFDAGFFSIPPKEAEKLDPQQRLLLETSFNAIEDAGIPLEKIYGSNTGVFIGCWINDFERRLINTAHDLDVYSTTGTGRYAQSGRLSFFYNLQGPSIAIDTACSSSLVAIHLAVNSLQSGECNLALAGASNTILDPFISMAYSRSGLLSEYGACYFGSENPDGYVRSEGAAVVILKRLKDALKDGNNVYGVIPGTACNNDGASDKYMLAPSSVTQQKMLEEAYRKAGVDPTIVKYIEAHGTGTKAGDPSEIHAVWNALASNGRTKANRVFVGSVKTNIGHTEAVAGFAGLFKAIMAIRNKTIPPDIHFYKPNPSINWDKMGVDIPTEQQPWENEKNQLRTAGVNAFGITGTNAHVIVQSFEQNFTGVTKNKKVKILPISGANKIAVKEYVELYNRQLNEQNYEDIVKNICFHKANLAVRKAILFDSFTNLKQTLNDLIDEVNTENVFEGEVYDRKPKIAFVFPGQGAQWQGMGKTLYHSEPIFKLCIDEFRVAFSSYVDWDLLEVLFSEEEKLNEIDVIQPALIAVEIALAKLWIYYGIQPDAVVGHSMGEVAAAFCAGIINAEDAARIICTRSKLMRRKSGNGAMGYIALPQEDVKNYIEKSGFRKVHIGVVNSPQSAVITGDVNEVEAVIQAFEKQEIFSRMIKVDVASHSYQMDELKPELFEQLQNIQSQKEQLTFYSTVLGAKTNGASLTADYWVKNLREPVAFSDTIQQLILDGVQLFIEVSPHPVLTQAIQENIEHAAAEANCIETTEKNKDEEVSFVYCLAKAFCKGAFVDWKNYYGDAYKKIRLPEYPWQKEYYWLKDSPKTLSGNRIVNGKAAHPFLQEYSFTSDGIKTHIWQSSLSSMRFPFLSGHKIEENIVFPAAAYLEVMHAVYMELTDTIGCNAENIEIKSPLYVNSEDDVLVKIILQQIFGTLYRFSFVSIQEDEEEHFTATVILNYEAQALPDELFSEQDLENTISAEQHYLACSKINLNYENEFRSLEKINYKGQTFIGSIALQHLSNQGFYFHPAWLDAAMQTALAQAYLYEPSTFIPHTCAKYKVYRYPTSENGKAVMQLLNKDENSYVFNLKVFNEDQLCVEFKECVFRKLEQTTTATNHLRAYFNVNYQLVRPQEIIENNPVLIIHNNLLSETVFKYFQKQQIQVDFLDIENYTTESFINALQSKNILPNTQLVFIPDAFNNWEESDAVLDAQQDTILPLVNIVQALVQADCVVRLWCITQNATSISGNDFVSTIHAQIPAFMRVLWNENFELRPSVVDIKNENDIELFSQIIQQAFPENEICIFNSEIYSARLNAVSELSFHVKKSNSFNTPFRTAIHDIGIPDSIYFQPKLLSSVIEDEICIEVEAAGVNFMNLMSVLGIYPGKANGFATLGIECVGIVKDKGKNVNHLNIGDRVFGMGYHTIDSHIIINAASFVKVPDGFTTNELATIPAVFLTAYYSLLELARIRKGERVLIHSATGGVGLAAIQICKLYGCEIFATAGNENKRAFLQEMGITNIYDSRSLDFYDEILKDTSGKGIDIVLNSLSGTALYKSMELLTDFGRFVEIGKKDIYDNSSIGLQVFKKSLSYFMVDLEKMLFEKPEILGELMNEIALLLNERDLAPLPITVFGITAIKDAFAFMRTSNQIGKIVIDFKDKENVVVEASPIFMAETNAAYLITGGYGGLGIEFAKMLADNGAKHIILVGRNQPNDSVLQQIQILESKGITIQQEFADISNYTALEDILNSIPIHKPLKGVFHLAGLLDDSAVMNLQTNQYYRVLSPKVAGALNLHKLTREIELDYFVLFSSSSVLFGSPGQAAYVAANAFMDALAHQRKLQHLPAQSIQWSTISDTGMAAFDANKAERLKAEGLHTLTSKAAVDIYLQLANDVSSSIGVFDLDIEKWQATYTSAKQNPYFDVLSKKDTTVMISTSQRTLKETLTMMADMREIESVVESKLKTAISSITKINQDKISSLSTFKSLGIDSLMSIQLKNQLEKIFDSNISVTSFWTHTTLKAYTRFLLDKMQLEVVHDVKEIKAEAVILQESENKSEQNTETNSELDELSKLLDDELNNL